MTNFLQLLFVCLAFSLVTGLTAQNNYFISAQSGAGPNVVGTYEVTSTSGGDGDDYEYTGPIEDGHENQNMFKIMRVDISPPPLPPGTIWDWQIRDLTGTVEEFKATGSGNTQPAAPDGNWLYSGGGSGTATGALLPVEFSHFRANSKSGQVELDWGTSSESNNKGFEVQHSTDARQWQVLEFIEGVGTTSNQQNYGYWHDKPAPGVNYYRLRQVDYDGAFDFSDMVSAQLPLVQELDVYPNPTPGEIRLIIPEEAFQQEMDVEVHNAQGQLLWQTQFTAKGAHQLLQLPTELPPGFYLLNTSAGASNFQATIVKQ